MTAWPVRPLGSLADPAKGSITDGPFGSNLTSAHYTQSGPLVVRLQNIGDGFFKHAPAHISREHYESLRKHTVAPGDLLVASLGESLPRACIAPPDLGPAIVKADCIRIRLGPEVDPRWVMYALQRPEARRWAETHLHGVGRPRLGLKMVREIPVPIPALAEQRRIVDILEGHLSRLHAANDYLQASLQRSETLRQLQVDLATTAGLPSARPGVRLPSGWFWRSIDEVTGGTPDGTVIGPFGSDLLASDYRAEGTPLVFVRDVRRAHFSSQDRRYVDANKADQLRRHVAKKGDVLVTKMGDPPGDAAVYDLDDEAIVTADVIRIRPSHGYDARFIAYAINSQVARRQVAEITRGVAQKKMSLGRFRTGVELPVPSERDQVQIVNRLESDLSVAAAVARGASAAADQSSRLRRALLEAAFSGRLTGNASDLDRAAEMVLS